MPKEDFEECYNIRNDILFNYKGKEYFYVRGKDSDYITDGLKSLNKIAECEKDKSWTDLVIDGKTLPEVLEESEIICIY